jgi:Acyl-CoA carboxylase epsilon subunit
VTVPADDGSPAVVLRVIRGDATPEEIAALVAVVLRAGAEAPGAAGSGEPSRRSAWSDRSRLLRAPRRPAPGAWRRSALPR